MTAHEMPTLEGIRRAAHELALHLAPTPLVRSEILSRAFEADVWLKLEMASPIASFKLRGALNAILQAQAQGGISAAVTSSTGNHGQGVAYAARLIGLPAQIFLPEPANPVKKAMIQSFGGIVHEGGHDLEAARQSGLAHCAANGGLFIDDGESLHLMEGAGTMGLEIAETLPDVDTLIVPMGSGNAVSGAAAALKAIQPGARAVGVQAKGAPAVVESFRAGKPIEIACDTLADGLAGGTAPELALAALLQFVDDAWLCDDTQIMAGVHTLAECAHVLVEPSGAAGVAAAWAHKDELKGLRIVFILTGANISSEMLKEALETPPLFTLKQYGGD
jgi:threonine dehydratase